MKLNKITTSNTKGRNIDCELSGRDIFTGPNGAGKTTHLESVMAGILGYIPGKGKKLEDVFNMASGTEMAITLAAENGFSCTRTINQKVTRKRSTGEKTYSLTSSTSIFPPKSEKTESQKKTRISEEFGDFALMFDLDEFLAMSDDKKRSFIFSLTDPSKFGWDKEKVFESIKKEFSDEDMLGPLEQIWDNNIGVPDNLANMVDWAKSQLSEAKGALKSAIASKQELLEQKQSMGGSQRPRHQIKEELDASREKLENTTKIIAANAEKVSMLVSLKEEKARLEEALKQDIPEPKNMDDLNKKLKLESDKAVEAKERVDRLRAKRSELGEKLAGQRSEKKVLQERLDGITQSIGICPLTGKDCPDSTAIEAFKKELKAKIEELSNSMKELGGMIEETDNIGLEAAASLSEKEASSNAIAKEIADEKVLIEKRKRIADIREDLEKTTRKIAETVITDTEIMEKAVAGIKERIAELEKEGEGGQEIHDIEKAFDRANLSSIDLEEKIERIEDLCILMGTGRLQGNILEDTVSPLVEKINQLLQKTCESYNLTLDLYDKNGRPTFSLAWDKGGTIIPFESLSGGEKAVFSVAILCALVIAKDPPVKVLCLEASEIDQKNLDMLLGSVEDFGSDIDNFLIATHITPSEAPSWSVHALG